MTSTILHYINLYHTISTTYHYYIHSQDHGCLAILATSQEELFSDVSLATTCPDGHCQVPAGHTWILDQSVDVQILGRSKRLSVTRSDCGDYYNLLTIIIAMARYANNNNNTVVVCSGADLCLLRTLTIFGTVKWDTEKDGLELRACYILVGEGGYFQVGSRTKPMEFLGVLVGIPQSHCV